MNKPNLIREVALQSGYLETDVRAILDTTGKVMTAALCQGSEIQVFGLGKMKTVERPEKKGRDIRRGLDIVIPARTAVTFSPSRPLALSVNGKTPAEK